MAGAVVLLLLAVTAAVGASVDDQAKAYIKKWSSLAVSEMRRSGVPASITLAQGMLESRYGLSELAVKANNHFGIKCHNWKGASIRVDDDKKGECFRKYSKAEDSFKDHSDFLRYSDRYKSLFHLKTTDYKGWATGLKKAGYATDPQYPQKLIDLIERYNLTRFDKGEVVPESPDVLETPVPVNTTTNGEVLKFSMTRQTYSQNNVPFIYSVEGETYKSIANDYNLFLSEILKYNDLKSAQELEPGTIVYLQPKKSKAAKQVDKYIAEGGETYWDVSQRFGIKLKNLLKMNGAKGNYELQRDDTVRLR